MEILNPKPFLSLVLHHSLVRPGQPLLGAMSTFVLELCCSFSQSLIPWYPWYPVLGLSTNKNVVLMTRITG